MTPDKALELKRSKRRALWLLLAAVAVFVTTILLPRGPWVDGFKAVAEAAMVGALADWFAVVALFRRVPIPFVSRHTEIIPKNKDKIADNLAVFVREKFLGPDALAAQIRQHDPARMLGAWLGEPANTDALGGYVTKLMSFALDMTDDARIQSFVHDAFRAVIDRVDLSQSAGAILDTLTKDGRHQALLDDAIEQVVDVLGKEENREVIAGFIVEWLKTQYPKVEKIMPTQWFGENGARMLASAVSRVLEGVAADPEHELRQRFDRTVVRLTERLKHDPAFIAKGDEIKRYIRDGDAFNDYVRDLWGQLRAWLKADLARADSALHRQAATLGGWLGARLAESPALRASLNEHIEKAVHEMAPDFADFLMRHIRDTVRNWDAREMSRQIELNIGKDLQYIRINGTLVGGLIGLGLYLVSLAPRWAAGWLH
ncbi:MULTISPECIES: DUF445 domain-containing protein [Burkholderia]|uniref:DUF445 domain-containing protein n=1 Tax=Burkholderia anthinoferrum TaxID=3090833 RepID=A0ABU5WLG3_9BURK|nr:MULTISPECIES: DUF445 domain-containing protein [Burkholderia]MEB2506302.1 DUF445 domain-containing protein [Burkholderia anthinoferrum]MEB2530060.1 DUF445 domain-containing protein [Burkholderia anthinoferrum]MEB2564308.1 DUF445 domain-containing protein [Burkholderia anthinoferrum]MEB2579794.1 DUF445 domain-containing protein [Burkholderia anthinoferrum]MCA7971908.1 DUF445 domain-containing protein [Burkholderia sp. AU39826]